MPLHVLICDDSGFARKQLARALPADWDAEISFAANGAEALAVIEEGKADLLFLDLNMPVMDGYQVLEAIRARDLPTLVIVVSGDVQEQARERVRRLGALDFIRKPVDPAEVEHILQQYGVLHELKGGLVKLEEQQLDPFAGYQEVANVAMGRAAALLAKLTGHFIDLPVPRVERLVADQLPGRIAGLGAGAAASVVTQGFVGNGVAGEAILILADNQLDEVARLLHADDGEAPARPLDLLMDISNVLTGSCISGFADQLDLSFSVGHPCLLAYQADLQETPAFTTESADELLCIEIHYGIREKGISIHLLMVFLADSLTVLDDRIALLLES